MPTSDLTIVKEGTFLVPILRSEEFVEDSGDKVFSLLPIQTIADRRRTFVTAL